MAKRPFFKRANRGLLLAAAVFVVLLIYVIASNAVFNGSKQDVLDFLRDYNRQIALYNTEMNDRVILGKGLSDADLAAKKQRAEEILNTYFYPDNRINYDLAGMEAVRDSMYCFAEEFGVYCRIDSMELSIGEVSGFKRLGQNYAKCSVKYTYKANITGTQSKSVLISGNYYGVYDTEIKPDTEQHECTESGTINYVLRLDGGKWRIVSETEGWGGGLFG